MLSIDVHLNYHVPWPMDILLQIEAADGYGQTLVHSDLKFNEQTDLSRIEGEDKIGERIWFNKSGDMKLDYRARVEIDRHVPDLKTLEAWPVRMLDAESTRYLMPSTYCSAFEFVPFVRKKFKGYEGGNLVLRIIDWMQESFEYVIGSSTPNTSASDTFVQRQGVCRDYAHVLIAMCRAAAIPARFASVYAPDVKPQDFHAVAEIFLDGRWHLIDATGMATADKMAVIGVGSDAADVAFMTSFGFVNFVSQRVEVDLS